MKRYPYVYSVLLFVVGAVLGFGVSLARPQTPNTDASVTREGGTYYINPLISCNLSEDIPYSGFALLQKSLKDASDQLLSQGQAKRISVYFRDMDHGYWTGVSANALFAPASLMKVPLLMAYLKASQTNRGLLASYVPLSVPEDQNAAEYFKPAAPLVVGRSYSIQELLNAMIEESDNNAAAVLKQHVDAPTLQRVYEDSNTPPALDESADVISPQAYMQYFRILYNATWLGRDDSIAALKLLGKTDFSGGIVSGVPKGMTVAHKFGERSVISVDPKTGAQISAKYELHDCGIVYYPNHPYGICIMTEGSDFKSLLNVISKLSQNAFTSVHGGLLSQ